MLSTEWVGNDKSRMERERLPHNKNLRDYSTLCFAQLHSHCAMNAADAITSLAPSWSHRNPTPGMNGPSLIAGINSVLRKKPSKQKQVDLLCCTRLISKNIAAKHKGTWPELQVLRAAPVRILVSVKSSLLKILVMGIPSSKAWCTQHFQVSLHLLLPMLSKPAARK